MSDTALKEATASMDENENIFRSCLEADRHVSFLTDFEEEDVGGLHSFLKPECSRDLGGSHLAFGTYELPNCFGVENFSSGFEYEEMTLDQDAVDSTIVVEKKTKTEILDEVIQGTDGRTKQGEGSLKYLSERCDNKASDEAGAINNDPSFEAAVGEASSPQNESTGGRDFVTNKQDMHPGSCALPESCIGDDTSQLDEMTICKLQDAFRNMFGRETRIRDKQWLKRRILFGIQNSGEAHKPLISLGLVASSGENEGRRMSICGRESCVISPCSRKLTPDSGTKLFKKIKESASDSLENYSSEGIEIGVGFHSKDEKDFGSVKRKRAHNPPRRYIEEIIKVNPRKNSKKSTASCKRPRDRMVDEKIHKPKEVKDDGNSLSVLQVGSFDGCIQVPFGLPVEEDNTMETTSYKPQAADLTLKGHHPTVSTLKRDPESHPAILQIIPKRPSAKARIIAKSPPPKLHVISPREEPVTRSLMQKGARRRKHHIPWTLSEVMKLIEGVSHLGVGRWSKIKRLLFATSKHRTSVDLKDKWRNLVKASVHMRRKKKGLQARKQLSHQAPESVLRQVRELADSRE